MKHLDRDSWPRVYRNDRVALSCSMRNMHTILHNTTGTCALHIPVRQVHSSKNCDTVRSEEWKISQQGEYVHQFEFRSATAEPRWNDSTSRRQNKTKYISFNPQKNEHHGNRIHYFRCSVSWYQFAVRRQAIDTNFYRSNCDGDSPSFVTALHLAKERRCALKTNQELSLDKWFHIIRNVARIEHNLGSLLFTTKSCNQLWLRTACHFQASMYCFELSIFLVYEWNTKKSLSFWCRSAGCIFMASSTIRRRRWDCTFMMNLAQPQIYFLKFKRRIRFFVADVRRKFNEVFVHCTVHTRYIYSNLCHLMGVASPSARFFMSAYDIIMEIQNHFCNKFQISSGGKKIDTCCGLEYEYIRYDLMTRTLTRNWIAFWNSSDKISGTMTSKSQNFTRCDFKI